MGFSTIDLLIGLAVGTKASFDALNKPEDDSPLLSSCVSAYRTLYTFLRHFPVLFCDCLVIHYYPQLIYCLL